MSRRISEIQIEIGVTVRIKKDINDPFGSIMYYLIRHRQKTCTFKRVKCKSIGRKEKRVTPAEKKQSFQKKSQTRGSRTKNAWLRLQRANKNHAMAIVYTADRLDHDRDWVGFICTRKPCIRIPLPHHARAS
jgi:hypothetical protein